MSSERDGAPVLLSKARTRGPASIIWNTGGGVSRIPPNPSGIGCASLRERGRLKVLPSEQTLRVAPRDFDPTDPGALHRIELATGARIVLPVPDDRSGQTRAVVETQYTFPSRKAFDDYVRLHAPALRADGLKHFPPDSGITYERQVAEIAAEF